MNRGDFMRRIKRVVACLCVCVLLATAPTTAYARATVYNPMGAVVELVTSAFCSTPHGALVCLAGMLGITFVAGVYDNRENIEKAAMDMYDRCERWFGKMADKVSVTWSEFESWLGDVANGALDTSSECWDAFLDFCTDLANAVNGKEDTGAGSGGLPIETVDGLVTGANPGWSENYRDFHAYKGIPINPSNNKVNIKLLEDLGVALDNYPYSFYPNVYPDVFNAYRNYSTTENWFMISMFLDERYGAGTFDLNCDGTCFFRDDYNRLAYYIDVDAGFIRAYYYSDAGVLKHYDYKGYSADVNSWSGETVSIDGKRVEWVSNIPFFTDYDVMLEFLDTGTLDSVEDWACVYGDFLPTAYSFTSTFDMVIGKGLPCDKDVPSDGAGDATGDAVFENVTDVVVAPPTEDIIDRDGNLDNVRVGGQTISGEIVIDGVISIPIDGVDLEDVSNPYNVIDGVYPIDIVTGVVIGSDIPIDDIPPVVVPQPSGDYTISGLDELFPFCIPFDLIDLFAVMKAEPEAPKFSFPIPVPDKGLKFHYDYIEIDLSKFNSVAKILRTMELLGFCVGLTIVTRNLIRG